MADSATHGPYEDGATMERRLFRGMCVVVVIAVAASAPLAPWRVTTGLLLGGILSLVNHRWLRTSIAAAFGNTPGRPRIMVARFLLRYFVAAALVAAAHLLGVASLTAALAGLCSFAVAALVEGFMQTYFAIVHREEN